MPSLKAQVSELMLKNRRTHGEYQYTLPSPDAYPYQWFWDSCFHAIILSHTNLESAKKELLSLTAKQFDNGMIPHMIYWQKKTKTDFPVIEWGKDDTSSITQPPMLAYAAWQIYQRQKEPAFLKKLYPSLTKLYHYFTAERDPHANHLISIINPDESGEDNSPRFDIPLGLPPKHSLNRNFNRRLKLIKDNKVCKFDAPFCMHNFFWVKDVPINAILVENLKVMSDIATVLDNPVDADYYFNQAKTISDSMRKLMSEDGLFWSIYYDASKQEYKKIKVLTWHIFAPLFAKIYSQKEAQFLVDHYLLNDKEFKLPYLCPTVSKSDRSFDPKGFWRGPVWININWFIYKGLKKYGFDKEAKKILDSSLQLLERSGFREQYNPLTGEGMGASNFTWGGLVLDMLEA